MKKITCTGCQQEYNNQDIFKKEYIRFFGDNRTITFSFHPECKEEAMRVIDSKFLVEEYRNHKIYLIDGGYIPYAECRYFFNTLEECKNRIDDGADNHIAVVPSGMLQSALGECYYESI